MFSLICTRINGWVNNHETGDLRRHSAHYDATVMITRVPVWCHSYHSQCTSSPVVIATRTVDNSIVMALSMELRYHVTLLHVRWRLQTNHMMSVMSRYHNDVRTWKHSVLVAHVERGSFNSVFVVSLMKPLRDSRMAGWNEMPKRPSAITAQHSDVIMGAMAPQITSLTIVYSNVYSGADQRKH